MRMIDLDELMKFPIRRDHCDKENANPNFINGIETVFEYAENLPTLRWIPVTERLPEHKTKVIVCDKENEKVTMSYFLYIMAGVRSFCIYDEDWSFSVNNVTHWMPFPTPPKDGDT